MNGDQADGAGRIHAADAFHHPHAGKAGDRGPMGSHSTSSLFLAPRSVALIQRIFAARLAVDRHDAKPWPGFAQHAQKRSGPASFSSRRMMRGFVTFAALFQPRQQALAGAERAAFLGRHDIDRGRLVIAIPSSAAGPAIRRRHPCR